ncbi:MAG: HAMP domain-containing protein [Pyrinomonadaceae bacterium]|nr:HAMP domain-containing protein [Acidobacteriota bacterium]MBK7934679.1 HAMP domain-containing protein [Acidobacteriota bacterium]MBP7376803.1 HAMP domain-containing protein [Pyrinomonadaceae bacterium]
MKLFLKIFLWFMVAISLMVGVMYFVTRTFQTEPMVNRWERSTRNQLVVYAGTVEQIARSEGEAGVRAFLTRLRDLEPPREVDLVAADDTIWFGQNEDVVDSLDLIARTRVSGKAETDLSADERSIAAAPVNFPDGRKFVLVLQWERAGPQGGLFFGSWLANLRLIGILLTAFVVCSLLAMYLTSPIRKLRNATKRLADGELETRVAAELGRRRDELADLARDFDNMAERIGSLITSQQRMTQDISHELRSPLARMNVALEIAKQKANPESAPMLERIGTESMRLNEMISRILMLAKLESGSDDYEHRRLDLAELVKDVAADADFEAQANGKVVEVSAADKCSVMGSENLLRSAIENVLRNAVRYTADRTVVDVSLSSNNGHAVLKVSDHGGGVPQDELANLFRPFYRVGEDRTRRTGGIGLGLAIAERAVKAHKGKIAASNVNGGLQVEIRLDTV